ncbi:U4/U6.U5 small nuclear ribonucleoprotein, partial [Coemansia sp. RSA 2131]
MNEEDQMMALMGFSGFDTTKDKAVAGNKLGTANIKKQRKFRQYMNRKGGFN